MMTFKFQRINEDEYTVTYNGGGTFQGVNIGRVWRGWWRLGGEGWTNNLRGHSFQAGKTRKAAAEDLYRRYRQTHEAPKASPIPK